MTGALAVAGTPRELWYLTRGAGAVSLVGLTATTTLGIVGTLRWSARRWPRFVLDSLHRNLALVTVCTLAIHILTSVIDGYAPISLLDAVIPFNGRYRPLWLGFGALAFDLLLAVGITSLVRGRLGHRAWRAVHWAAYACWPIAVVHALGTGSDVRAGWLLVLGLGCVVVVLVAAGWRLAGAQALSPGRRSAAAGGILASLIALGAWAAQGPLAHGWARRAGTPASLLGGTATTVADVSHPRSAQSRAPRATAAARAHGAFTGHLIGPVQQAVSADGQRATLELPLTVSGDREGTLDVRLHGQPLAGGGINMSSSDVRLDAGGLYLGHITSLKGTTLDALVSAAGGRALRLRIALAIDPKAGTASGTLSATPAGGASA